jgi:hypothetical protein
LTLIIAFEIFKKSIGTPTPKVGAHLGAWGFNVEWATIAKEPTNMFPQLDGGIDVYTLVNDGFPLAKPLIGLKDYLCMLDVIWIPIGIN